MSQIQLPQLLLRNDKVHRNLCSLNSILQLLRHIPEFLSQLSEWKNASPILTELSLVLSKTGRNEVTSALQVRHLLAQATGQPLNSGAQHDTVELFSFLLEHCPSQLFLFSVDHQYRFRVNDRASPCPTCQQYPPSFPSTDTILKVAIPASRTAIPLQHLINQHFAIHSQFDGRSCGNCLTTIPHCPKLPYMEKLSISKHPRYLLIQILRMEFRNGKTEKNSTAVDIFSSEIFDIDKSKYKIIGTISHMGTAENGHNRAYIKKDSDWSYVKIQSLP